MFFCSPPGTDINVIDVASDADESQGSVADSNTMTATTLLAIILPTVGGTALLVAILLCIIVFVLSKKRSYIFETRKNSDGYNITDIQLKKYENSRNTDNL